MTKKPDLESIVHRLEPIDAFRWRREKKQSMELDYRHYFSGTLLTTDTKHFSVTLYGGTHHRSCNCGTDDWGCSCDTAARPYYRLALKHKTTGDVLVDETTADGPLKALSDDVNKRYDGRQACDLAKEFGG
jgi:hypothetical protein